MAAENSDPVVLAGWQLPQRVEEEETPSLALGDLAWFSLGGEAPAGAVSQAQPIDSQEIYDLIATISDPEHPLTLGQLAVVKLDDIHVTDSGNISEVHVELTPTITHCSLATLIGLGVRVRLERSLPPRFRAKITLAPGSHESEAQVNKQLNDKERVAAACENEQLSGVIQTMLKTC